MAPEQRLPIRVVVTDDAAQARLTVFFRLLLAIPHLIMVLLFGVAAITVSLVLWLALLIEGRAPRALQEFVATYIRYATQVSAYLYLAAAPYPSFGGARGYPVDLEIELSVRQSRGTVAARLVLAVPALVLVSVLGGGLTGANWSAAASVPSGSDAWWSSTWSLGGLAWSAALLAWFAALVRGRVPLGLRDLIVYCIGYAAQTAGYFMLVTDHYPTSDPSRVAPFLELPAHPVRLDLTDHVRRSRLTVFFRFPLAVPHLIWLTLWSLLVVVLALPAWIATLVSGRLPSPFHRFLSSWIRYATHVLAFLYVIGGPFPGFTGAAGTYPVDITIAPLQRQRRLVTAFRVVLVMPALLLAGAYGTVALVVALLGWWAALVTGRMPEGLRNLGAVALRYSAQANAYLFLLTESYAYATPAVRDRPRDVQLELPFGATSATTAASEAF